jgi:hypothetical protein
MRLNRSDTRLDFTSKSMSESGTRLGVRFTSSSQSFKFSSTRMSKPRSSKQDLCPKLHGRNISIPLLITLSAEMIVLMIRSSILERSSSVSIPYDFMCSNNACNSHFLQLASPVYFAALVKWIFMSSKFSSLFVNFYEANRTRPF